MPADLHAVADDLNTLSAFFARRGCPGIESCRADVGVLMGTSVLAAADTVARGFAAGAFPRVLVTGGVGHSTEFLRDEVRRHHPDIGVEGRGEAEILGDLLGRLSVPRECVLVETAATHTGENARFALDMLEGHERLVIVQDPTMQLRSHLTFVKERGSADGLVSFAPFVPRVHVVDGDLAVDPPAWPWERFLALVLGEVPRLRQYGPMGRGFIAHVDIPPPVADAHERLARWYPAYVRV